MSGNLLFKTFPTSFIYDLTEIFCFAHKEIQDLYKTYLIEKVEILHILTDTDSRRSTFIFISDL